MAEIVLSDIKILIVEDDFSSRLYLNKILERSGAVLFNAENGQDAINITQENPDIDLILMDIQMPIVDGYAATEAIRKFRSDVIIIAQTAFGLMGDREKILESGFNDYLIKPIMSKILFEKILSYLSQDRK